MFNLDKIRVVEYLRLDEESVNNYGNLQRVLLPQDNFLGVTANALGSLTFSQVKDIQSRFANPSFDDVLWAFDIFFGSSKHQVLRSSIIDFFYAVNWMVSEVVKSINNENKALAPSEGVDPDLELAGADRLNIFGDLNTLCELGERYSKEPSEIGEWKYNTVFAIMVKDKVEREVKAEYQRIKTERSKQ